MPETMMSLLQKYVCEIRNVYGNSLRAVILYGSYARGDYRPDSDVDIMILVDLADEKIREKSRSLSDVTYDYNDSHNLMIMPIVKNEAHFNKWLRAYPFYNTIKREGVELYAS